MPLKLFRRMTAGLGVRREFAGPAGTRAYAVGDIHGRLDLLDELLGQIEDDIHARPVERAAVVFLGDFIDRGPDSAGVVERLSTLANFPAQTLFLLGNHEEVMLRVLAGEPDIGQDWLGFGGDACVASYGMSPQQLQTMDERQMAGLLAAAVPAHHVAFLKSCGDTFQFGDYLFVHAGIRPGIPIEEQDPADLRWIRRPFLTDSKDHGCMVVHGHTISEGVDILPNRIGIDTGAYRTGVLTAIAIEGAEQRFLATGGTAAGCGK